MNNSKKSYCSPRAEIEKLCARSTNNVCHIYEVVRYYPEESISYELRFNSLAEGDPVYRYKTLRGAKIAMSRMLNGRYSDLTKPSTLWGDITDFEISPKFSPTQLN